MASLKTSGFLRHTGKPIRRSRQRQGSPTQRALVMRRGRLALAWVLADVQGQGNIFLAAVRFLMHPSFIDAD